MDDTYASLMQQDFSMDCGATQLPQHGFGKDHATMIELQKQTIALAKKQQATEMDLNEEDDNEAWMPSGASQPAQAEWVPMPLAKKGPAAVALHLLRARAHRGAN